MLFFIKIQQTNTCKNYAMSFFMPKCQQRNNWAKLTKLFSQAVIEKGNTTSLQSVVYAFFDNDKIVIANFFAPEPIKKPANISLYVNIN